MFVLIYIPLYARTEIRNAMKPYRKNKEKAKNILLKAFEVRDVISEQKKTKNEKCTKCFLDASRINSADVVIRMIRRRTLAW